MENTQHNTMESRSLNQWNPMGNLNRAMEMLHSPELTQHPHGASISLLSTWDHPPLELLHSLYFIEMLWGYAPGKNELLEIAYRDYQSGGSSMNKLVDIASDMGEEYGYNSSAMRKLHKAAIKEVITLYSKELTEVHASWKSKLPKNEQNQNITKFFRTQLKEEIEDGSPWGRNLGTQNIYMEPQDFRDAKNREFNLRASHLALKGVQFGYAMELLRECFLGPTGKPSNFAPMTEYLGSEERARLLLKFTKLGLPVEESAAKAMELGTLELRYAPLVLHCHHLTLDSMIHFASLLEEYNEDWALAAMEWNSKAEEETA